MADQQDREQQKYDRRAQALRANLRRRKQQKKQRASDDIVQAPSETGDITDPDQM